MGASVTHKFPGGQTLGSQHTMGCCAHAAAANDCTEPVRDAFEEFPVDPAAMTSPVDVMATSYTLNVVAKFVNWVSEVLNL